MATKRKTQLVQAARLRAELTGIFNQAPAPVALSALAEKTGATRPALDRILRGMVRNGACMRAGTGLYALAGTAIAHARPDPTQRAVLQIDAIKSSGRVRITLQGLTIEVGVVP